jgi:hypothetical protein
MPVDVIQDGIAAAFLTIAVRIFNQVFKQKEKRTENKGEGEGDSLAVLEGLKKRIRRLEDERDEEHRRWNVHDYPARVRALEREARRRKWRLSRVDDDESTPT